MFKFLFRGRDKDAVVETQRQSFERIVSELNGAIDALPVKPSVTLDPESGHITLHLPEHMPDEALALPAPEDDGDATSTNETPEAVTQAAETKVA